MNVFLWYRLALKWAKVGQENLLRMVRWMRWHCPPDTGFYIKSLVEWDRARYLSSQRLPQIAHAKTNSSNCLLEKWVVSVVFLFTAAVAEGYIFTTVGSTILSTLAAPGVVATNRELVNPVLATATYNFKWVNLIGLIWDKKLHFLPIWTIYNLSIYFDTIQKTLKHIESTFVLKGFISG